LADRGSLILGAPFFLFFGWLSDKVGRKPIILGGCLLAALLYFPIFYGLTLTANPALAHAQETAPVTVIADPAQCSFQFDPIENADFVTSCDLARTCSPIRGELHQCRGAGGLDRADHDRRQGDRLVRRRDPAEGATGEEARRLRSRGSAAIAAAGYPPPPIRRRSTSWACSAC